jgi:hypothetical protein
MFRGDERVKSGDIALSFSTPASPRSATHKLSTQADLDPPLPVEQRTHAIKGVLAAHDREEGPIFAEILMISRRRLRFRWGGRRGQDMACLHIDATRRSRHGV